jgi:hypothetical protein
LQGSTAKVTGHPVGVGVKCCWHWALLTLPSQEAGRQLSAELWGWPEQVETCSTKLLMLMHLLTHALLLQCMLCSTGTSAILLKQLSLLLRSVCCCSSGMLRCLGWSQRPRWGHASCCCCCCNAAAAPLGLDAPRCCCTSCRVQLLHRLIT